MTQCVCHLINQGSSYFIYYCGPKQLALSIPDERNREAVLDNIDRFLVARFCGAIFQRFFFLPSTILGDWKISHIKRESSTFQKKMKSANFGEFCWTKTYKYSAVFGLVEYHDFFDSINFHPIFLIDVSVVFLPSQTD